MTAAVFDIHYQTPSILIVAAASILPDADYPKSWTGRMLGFISEDLHRFFGHRSFLHSWLAWILVTGLLAPPLWWVSSTGPPPPSPSSLATAPTSSPT